ncbi:MAG: J domain-containing protein [Synergistaceae bacterium]|jgi:hypothetical protein|nr:J domain-containing protein [Synergistaceae bacterium]
MEDCHALLGIHPASGSDEIEEAYRRKKHEYAPSRFTEGSSEWKNAVAMQKKLEQAYDEAIMASFAPIRATSPPSRPAPAPSPQIPRQEAPRQEALRQEIPQQEIPKMQVPRKPNAAPRDVSTEGAPLRSSWTPTSRGPELDGLVEEVPVALSDEDLLKMDISQLRETYVTPPKEPSPLFTLGIEDPLLRTIAWMFLSFTLLDFLMRVMMGGTWANMSGFFRLASGMGDFMNGGAVVTGAPPPAPSVLWSLITSIVSMGYIFACSLVMPIAVRFFLLGEPMAGRMRIFADVASIAAAAIVMLPVGLIFKILPAEWAGSDLNLFFVTPAICEAILKYGGR